MRLLSLLCSAIDRLSSRLIDLAVLFAALACAATAVNAILRKAFNFALPWLLEAPWYLYSAAFMLGAVYALASNQHIRVDVIYGGLSQRARARIDVLGFLGLGLPAFLGTAALCWHPAAEAWISQETYGQGGNWVLWPIRLLIAASFLLLALQCLANGLRALGAARAGEPR